MIYELGTPINLVEQFWAIDPLTLLRTPANPTTVTFTVLAPDGTSSQFVWPGSAAVTNPAVGTFVCALTPATLVGAYDYRAAGTGVLEAVSEGSFQVVESAALDPTSPEWPTLGPCTPWATGEDVIACDAGLTNRDATIYDSYAYAASEFLFEVSGRQFTGRCVRTVRPCGGDCDGGAGDLASGLAWYWGTGWMGGSGYGYGFGWYRNGVPACGCDALSIVKLPGYPVTSVLQVKIGGVVLPEYDVDGNRQWRVDDRRTLVRMDTPVAGKGPQQNRWPSCQNLALDDTQPGTFSVSYYHGADPPRLGRDAAAALAARLYRANNGLPCGEFPTGATTITREGVRIERNLLAEWFNEKKTTGVVQADMFLAAYWPQRRGRRPAVFSPDVQRYAKKVGR